MRKDPKTEAMNRIAEQAVPDTVDLWPEIRSRVELAGVPAPTSGRRAWIGKGRGRRLMVAGLAAGVLLALAVGGTLPLWNTPETVDAQAILERAQSTVDSSLGVVKTYHLQMTRQSAKSDQPDSTEVWFGGSDRQHTRQEIRDAGGRIVSSGDVVFNGDQTWIATTENGQTRVVHTVGTTWNKLADDPSQQISLSDVLARYRNNKECMDAQLQGEGNVANRATYVIAVTPKPGDCVANLDPVGESKARQAIDSVQGAQEKRFGQMLVWVDKLSFLPLKTEVRDSSGIMLDRSEVTNVEYEVPIPESIFSYTPPPGATVSNFTGGTGADVKKALYGDPVNKKAPSKQP